MFFTRILEKLSKLHQIYSTVDLRNVVLYLNKLTKTIQGVFLKPIVDLTRPVLLYFYKYSHQLSNIDLQIFPFSWKILYNQNESVHF